MSPEQLRSSRTVDHRTDIWALGVVLYELLEGRRAFTAQDVIAKRMRGMRRRSELRET